MPLKINNNSSLGTQRSLRGSMNRLQNNLNRLSSGKRLNSAADDAAALAISQMMGSELRSLNVAQRNVMDGVSMIQTAEGGMAQQGEILGRMRELALQAGNGTLSDEQRGALNDEFSALSEELDRISSTTEFNGQKLLDGSASGGVSLQVDTDPEATGNQLDMAVDELSTSTLGNGGDTIAAQSLGSQSSALDALAAIDGAQEQLSSARAGLGALQNRLTSTFDNLAIERENIMAANSRLEDADVAAEASGLASNQILTQASVAMLGQANKLSASTLSLLK